MTRFLGSVLLGLATSFILGACNDKNTNTDGSATAPETKAPLSRGVSVNPDSPFAEDLPWFSTCGAIEPEVAALCPANRVPFMGDYGRPVTREIIKNHALALDEDDRTALSELIDELPESLLPHFARFRVFSHGYSRLSNDDLASFGILSPIGRARDRCEGSTGVCAENQGAVPKSLKILRVGLLNENSKRLDRVNSIKRNSLIEGICNAADAHVTHDLRLLNERTDKSTGKTAISRFSQSKDYTYTLQPDLKEFWQGDESTKIAMDPERLAAAIKDSSFSALNSSSSYSNSTEDFLATCMDYLQWKSNSVETAVIVIDPKSGRVFGSRTNQIAEPAVKDKLLKMLPAIESKDQLADEASVKLPQSSELTEEQVQSILSRWTFE